jgi:predicted outer membrane repeat protein
MLVLINALLVSTEAIGALCLPMIHKVNVGSATGAGTGCDYVYADLQTAINNVACPNTVISIAGGVTLANVALEINGKTNLTIVGLGAGTTCLNPPPICDPDVGCSGGGAPVPNVTLQGTGSGSVFYIHGNSSVTLESLTLKKGGGTDFGGGIHFTGAGSLTIVGSTITDNSANSQGGGIQFNGSGGNATLTIGAGTLVTNNTSGGDGGGIHVNGSARLFALQPYTFISSNTAANHGGGMYVSGPAQADIGSPGYNGAPVISFNSAAYGGGIAMDTAPDDATATVRVFTTDPHVPVSISNNTASSTGGGIWTHPFISGISGQYNPIFCANDFHIDHNIAQEGTAIYSDTDSSIGNGNTGGYIYLNNDPGGSCSTPESISTLGAVRCAPGVECNTLNGNVAENSSSSPTPGSVILLQDQGNLLGTRFTMRNNTAQHAIRTLDGNVKLDTCLIADNTLTAEMLRFENDGTDCLDCTPSTTVEGCTVVNNSDQGAPVIQSGHALALTDSIIDESGINTVNYAGPGGGLTASAVLATDISTLPSAAGIDLGEPLYVDAANHDYHLQPTSTGIDFAPAKGGIDLDGNPRDVNLSGVPGNPTPRDIGAYERQNRFQCGTSNSIFCNGYEYSW